MPSIEINLSNVVPGSTIEVYLDTKSYHVVKRVSHVVTINLANSKNAKVSCSGCRVRRVLATNPINKHPRYSLAFVMSNSVKCSNSPYEVDA